MCGAHHPSDVLEDQLLAVQYFKAASLTAAFRETLDLGPLERGGDREKAARIAGCLRNREVEVTAARSRTSQFTGSGLSNDYKASQSSVFKRIACIREFSRPSC
jgi:hypothetical protein